ncbi:hypothetical protein NDF60_28600 [Streptomyces sp. STCH 565 A]|nr:hypothetical protein [Streptomyces sp. STCH 565 A]
MGPVVDLVELCEALEEEAEEVENRREPDYVPDLLKPNFNGDHWRYLQCLLAATTDGLQAHPWLYDWARPTLARAAAYAERRCEEQRTLIDTVMIERAAVALQQRETSSARLAQAWQTWRQRQDHTCNASPDHAYYNQNARLQPLGTAVTGRRTATVEISVRIPPFGPDELGYPMVEPLSMWEIAAIAAYKTTADWTGGIVALAVPPVVAQELLSPARALDVTPASDTRQKP